MAQSINYIKKSDNTSSVDLSNYFTKTQTSTLVNTGISSNNVRTELEDGFKYAYSTYYKDCVRSGKVITQINIWVDSSKAVKLFTKNFTRVGNLVTGIELIDETTGNRLIKGFTYLDGEWVSTGVSFIGA